MIFLANAQVVTGIALWRLVYKIPILGATHSCQLYERLMKSKPTYFPPEIASSIAEASKLRTEGRFLEAEGIYRRLATAGSCRFFALEALADLYLQQQRLDEALHALRSLTEEDPDNLHYCAQLAKHLDELGETQAAVDEYVKILDRHPEFAVGHYNLALLHTKLKQYPDALAAYERAADLRIDQVEEVYSNMGVLYSDMQESDMAVKMYQRALEIAPGYVPALFNLAGHLEETDEKDHAIERYENILSIDATHWKSLARLAYPRKVTSENYELIERLEAGIKQPKENILEQEGLYFALGKAFDDLREYDKAATAYTAGNELGQQRSSPYDKITTERAFDQLIEIFDAEWISKNASSSAAAPIFICGMFRSGSTLLEQMLGAHSSVTAGGEIEVLPWLVGSQLAPYPHGVRSASRDQLHKIGAEYLSKVRELLPDHVYFTDKRPDNYLHIGLIKILFPSAKIIHTRRGLLDNCLSLYFQQLGSNFSYSTDLDNTAHYIHQHDRLMAHWRSCLGAEIFDVDYEEMVESPEALMRRLIDHIGLEWDPRILEFQKTKSLVKTPSLWQVREKVHTRSKERWRNYEALLKNIRISGDLGKGIE